MNHRQQTGGSRLTFPFGALCAAAAALASAHAAETPARGAPEPTSTETLARLMIEKGVITPAQGEEIISRARVEALHAESVQSAAIPPPAAEDAPPKDGVVRVQHVPESLKRRLREDIKQEVMAQARRENWAAPEAVPEWVKRFRVTGDVRLRQEFRMYPGQANTSGDKFPDFNAVNRGAPFDESTITNPNFMAQRNVDQDRQRMRLRVRLASEIDLHDGFTAGVRFVTGNENNPVTANQSLGQNGGFAKYAIWLDRGFLKYETPSSGDLVATAHFGRFDNLLLCSPMIWDEDIGFDGIAAQLRYKANDTFTPFFTGILSPVFNTDMNFSSNQPAKFKSNDKWLYTAQIGTAINATKDLKFRTAATYYGYQNVQGVLSTPFTPLSAADAGDTDGYRPAFGQAGNTYRRLRNILPDPALNGAGTERLFQYYGLASDFKILALTARADYDGFGPLHLSLVGEVTKNTGYEENEVSAFALNNMTGGNTGAFDGGDMGYDLQFNVGSHALEKWGDWIVGVGYRYVESDAVMDGFSNSDFGNGGTNLQGYILSASLALTKSVFVQTRWFSAESIAGPKFKADTLFFDISGRF